MDLLHLIKKAWEDNYRVYGDAMAFKIGRFQSINLQLVDEVPDYGGSVHERVDSSQSIEVRDSNERLIGCVTFQHFHRQQRDDNWGCRVYLLKDL